MNRNFIFAAAVLFPSLVFGALDTAEIEATTGIKGTYNQAEGVFKVTAPRNDVKITVDDWQMPPFMGANIVGGVHAGNEGESDGDGRSRAVPARGKPRDERGARCGTERDGAAYHFFYDDPRFTSCT